VAVKSVSPRVQIIAVESERAPGFYASMKGMEDDLFFLIFIHSNVYLFQLVDLFLQNVTQH
jgi:hypothetical protein